MKVSIPRKPKVLGDGAYGVCVELGKRRVLKITTSEDEYYTASQLVGKKLRKVWRIYEAGEATPEMRRWVAKLWDHDGYLDPSLKGLWYIVGEKVFTLEEYMDGDYYDCPDLEDFANEVNYELMPLGLYHGDIHYRNVGYRLTAKGTRGRVLVAYDVQ